MSYLNPPYPNNFQELCVAMPIFYLDVREMRAVLRAQGRLLDGVCGGVENVVDFNFILTADDATIRMWEKAFKITYKSKLTLDQRRHVVIGYIIGFGHIGEKEIRAIISQYTPNCVDFDFMRGTISILVEGEIFDEENLLETLLRRIPAHLGLKMSIHIRKQYRQTIPLSQGGAIGSYFFFDAGRQDRKAVRVKPQDITDGKANTQACRSHRTLTTFETLVLTEVNPSGICDGLLRQFLRFSLIAEITMLRQDNLKAGEFF